MLLFHVSHSCQRRTFITQYSRDRISTQRILGIRGRKLHENSYSPGAVSSANYIFTNKFMREISGTNIVIRATYQYEGRWNTVRKRLPCICYLLVALNHNFIGMTYLSDQYCKNMLNTTVVHVLYVFVHSS